MKTVGLDDPYFVFNPILILVRAGLDLALYLNWSSLFEGSGKLRSRSPHFNVVPVGALLPDLLVIRPSLIDCSAEGYDGGVVRCGFSLSVLAEIADKTEAVVWVCTFGGLLW